MMKSKKELRKEILIRRNGLSQEERHEKSKQIGKRVIQLAEFQDADVIFLYSPIKSEVETADIYKAANRLGKKIYYPRVLGETMEFYLTDETSEMELSIYGIKEPKSETTNAFCPSNGDKIFVLLPGTVFDEAGNRIGYGGGYYDKYLHGLMDKIPAENICKVAVAYECQMVEKGIIESKWHDVKADYIVTERKNRDINKN